MIHRCCDARRRNEVAAHPVLNGIDYLEVVDRDAPAGSPRQRTLLVRFLKPVQALTADNLRIEGGGRERDVRVEWAVVADAVPPAMVAAGRIGTAEATWFASLSEPERVLVVRTSSAGDYETYRLRVVTADDDPTPPSSLDPRLAWIDFSFKVECEEDFDCAPSRTCAPVRPPEPRIDYLARDYASLRRMMLDRMSLLLPEWRERSAADQGIALVELLAYVGDHLHYQLDATVTEAYLGTARRRVSVRRHARLVDYFMSDGQNARTWVHLEVSADVLPVGPDVPVVPVGTRLLTAIPGTAAPTVPDDRRVWGDASLVFQTMEPVRALHRAHNGMTFHTWSDRECWLPAGSVSATLAGAYPALEAGMLLVFEEVLGPRTGHPGDADPERRHAVRLTRVAPSIDPVDDSPVTEIEWSEADALPFPLCLSARTDRAHGSAFVDGVSVARGNIVLADHGLTIVEELPAVPGPVASYAPVGPECCDPEAPVPIVPRYRPVLAASPLTQAAPYTPGGAAADAMRAEERAILPEVELVGTVHGVSSAWTPRRDLLGSDTDHRHFVVEVERDGRAVLRFGDDEHGERPEPGTAFVAIYRVGNGRAGNLGPDTLRHIAIDVPEIVRVRNLTPGLGGRDPETIEEVRQKAPVAFRRQERAVTNADWEEMAGRLPDVQRAAASSRWTGSWHTVFLTVDRVGGGPVDRGFEDAVRGGVERYRMAGQDLEVDAPRPVSLELELHVCVHPDHFRSDVRAALRQRLGSGTLPDGGRALFHPDDLTFGQPVHLSRVYAAVQQIPGVLSARVTTFRRQGEPESDALDTGRLEVGRYEIARLANDPSHPDHGVLRLELEGGK